MTMINAVPRFGIRWAVVLAVVAAVALAALLAVGSPASAQSAGDEIEIWSATITVGMEGSGRGFHNRGVPEDYGSISDDDFSVGSDDYEIDLVADTAGFNGVLIFAVRPQLDATSELLFTLHVRGRTFDFNDATVVVDGTLHAYQWRGISRIDWAENDEVVVKITEKKSISLTGGLTASHKVVEYGGNNNAAESTAIFWFTRTGNTDEALTFTFRHVQSGETATRTFEAGQSEFFNAHWAIDVDESNNPVCLITWEILSPVPGYVFNFNPAFAEVKGPGTTCMSGI